MDLNTRISSQLTQYGKTRSPDVVCFSHLRWDFVFQRPQHLMTRFAQSRRVFFIEEPIMADGDARWDITEPAKNLIRCVPHLPHGTEPDDQTRSIQQLVSELSLEWGIDKCVEWYYTPMMLEWAERLNSSVVVYDCMDELSKFRFAPTRLFDLERKLFSKADLVFTGGNSLYNAKKKQHRSVHEFPSSIEAAHFRQALFNREDPADQVSISRPRIGYAGVIDERIDLELIDAAAAAVPDWNFIMIGPVVKIDPESLPRRANIHYLGQKPYTELPMYFSGWDVGMMPFALNESTEFISPTKTPEYLAAGLPVVSTAITDVVRPYGEEGLVKIADDAASFVKGIKDAMEDDPVDRIRRVDEFLAGRSWDITQKAMANLIKKAGERTAAAPATPQYREIPSLLG